ncbi:tyrosine recombinase XerC [Clostridium beijerinckii]|uniref:tyrosine recombinase XerC n=1 Tax=Clostridium beijerinckii TaxID=1520 RepID=UPI0015712E86|nr:tyrosine recombinase XerC [Clostridium beijerinckii]NRU52442.1 site-specific recombinase XerD [Clostridium beijerinckii]NYC69113.1 site-specific recombinase XerD [Clostridium beijerinckii]NYC91926.1 site-specific recombinase XerD [Clostridium beijerinckii]
MKYATIQNNDIPESLSDFLNYLETIKSKSINTINGYKIDLTVFFKFMMIHKKKVNSRKVEFEDIDISNIDDDFIRDIKLKDMYAYLSFAEKLRKNGSYGRARKVASLKSFFKFLFTKAKVITENPTLELETPKLDKRLPVYLTLNQSIHLLESLNKEDKNYARDYCILTFFLNCGMRLSELCSIRTDKIKEDTLTIIGKGNKERTIYLNDACLNAFNNYMTVRDDSQANEENKKFLFLSARNTPINKRTVEIMVKKHITNAGLTDAHYTVHKLRHTASTLMYKYGNVDVRSLQQILGHSNISSTMIYTHVDEDQLRESVKNNPLNKI